MPETQDWAAPTQTPARNTGTIPFVASEAGTAAQIIGGVAAQQISLLSLALIPDWTSGDATLLRDWVGLEVYDFPASNTLAVAAISPYMPWASPIIPQGAAIATVGQPVYAHVTSRKGAGSQSVIVVATYYYLGT